MLPLCYPKLNFQLKLHPIAGKGWGKGNEKKQLYTLLRYFLIISSSGTNIDFENDGKSEESAIVKYSYR